jgi:heme A synthase
MGVNFKWRDGRRLFARFAWSVLAYNVLVILWGAVVRATGSGTGCGAHWPLCGDQVIPHAAEIATLIEFAHRATSGLALLLVVALVFLSFRCLGKGHPARRYSVAALCFTLTEGLIGAALVLYAQVTTNPSWSGVFVFSLHSVNTLLLLGALALTARAAGQAHLDPSPWVPQPGSARSTLPYAAGVGGALAIAVSGTIAALGDSIFHSTSLVQSLHLDFSHSANLLLRLRIVHPALAVILGGFLVVLSLHALTLLATRSVKRLARYLLALLVLQFVFGVLNVVLLTPPWMQVLHLLAADLVWITLVLLCAEVAACQRVASAAQFHPDPAAAAVGLTAHPGPSERT